MNYCVHVAVDLSQGKTELREEHMVESHFTNDER